MKKFLLVIALILLTNPVFAQNCPNCDKCSDLMDMMYNNRATMYNVLNLSPDQQKCKDTMDAQYLKEIGDKYEKYEQEKFVLKNMQKHNVSKSALRKQEKVIKTFEKSMENLNDKYTKEFKSILDSEQKSKLNAISRMQKKELKNCNKTIYKRDSKLRPFGEKMYYDETQKVICPVHNKRHLFGRIHR